MKDMLLHAIDKLTAAGFTPHVTICDQGSNNRSSIGKLDITVSRPYFEHNGHRDICMYDPPHLLKNIRNNLKKTGYTVNGQKISWEHISSFYYKDINTGPLRYAPSLTEKHIRLPPFAALRVCQATQVFSHYVAVGIAAISQLPTEAVYNAAEFLE